MSTFYVIIGVILCLLCVFVVCLAAVWLEKRFPGKNHDERQARFRGQAYRLSFWLGLIYYWFVTTLLIAQQKLGQTIEPYLLVLGGIILQVVVYRTYCMITRSFMTLSQKPAGMIVFDLILGIIAIQFYRWSLRWDILEEMGYPVSYEWIFLILAVILFSSAFCYLCQVLYRRLRGEED